MALEEDRKTTHRPILDFNMVLGKDIYTPGYVLSVPMVLNQNGIKPTFFKLVSWSPGAFYSYYNLQCIKLDKGKRIQKIKISFMHTKNI